MIHDKLQSNHVKEYFYEILYRSKNKIRLFIDETDMLSLEANQIITNKNNTEEGKFPRVHLRMIMTHFIL